jgi:tetratricopeptide (TPR) repeat protein
MSRLYDALTALERKRSAPNATPIALVSRDAPTRRRWAALAVVSVALAGAGAVTVLPRDRSTAAPPTTLNSPPRAEPVRAPAVLARARQAAMLGMLDEAETLLEQVTKLTPAEAAVWNDLGVVRVRRAQIARAIEAFERSVALDASYAVAHRNLAVALERAGKGSEAAAHYRAFLTLSPDDPDRERVSQRLARLR